MAEVLFERYLDEMGYGWEYEPNLGPPKPPDYLVDVNGVQVVCEVKAFDTQGDFTGQFGARSMKDVLKPHRNDIKKAALKLKGLQDRGWPLVVVLSNPGNRPVLTDPKVIISAMYGDLVGSATFRNDGSLGQFTFRADRNGKLRNDHQYISAVAMLRVSSRAKAWSEEWIRKHRSEYADVGTLVAAYLGASENAPKDDDVSLDVFETVSSAAEPLARNIFNGPRDRRWGLDPAGTGLIEVEISGPCTPPD